jgi:hypothetical protein
LLQIRCHSVAVVLTLVQTKQMRINTHKRNNTKTQYEKYQNTVRTIPKHSKYKYYQNTNT